MPSPEKRRDEAWHTLPVEAVYERLHTGRDGLTEAEATGRLARWGPNELQATRRRTAWSLLLAQFKDLLILILIGATVLSLFLGHGIEAVVILVIVLFAVLLGFVQEYRAERAIEALRRMAAPTATVLRNGREVHLPASRLVPGDVVLLQTGNRVPADVRLTEAVNLQVEEAVLTGESVPVPKHTEPLTGASVPVGDRVNMAFAGTTVTYGRGRGVVVATGMHTAFGQIATMLETVEVSRTPLQQNLDRIGRVLAGAALVVVVLIVALGLLRGQPFLEMFLFGIALAVAVVPEALPAVVTISLALGVRRLLRRNALIRRLPAVETLGSTSVICSDKTGTLTRDEMTARVLVVAGQTWQVTGAGYTPEGDFVRDGTPAPPSEAVRLLLRTAVLASDAHLRFDEEHKAWEIQGDPTEGALLVAAAKAGLEKEALDERYPRLDEIPFSSETKRMTTLHEGPEGPFACAKGAPEVILPACTHQRMEHDIRPLTADDRDRLLETARHLAEEALRVLAVAFKPGARANGTGREDAETDMTFLGLVGLIDPPRPEAAPAVATCRSAGITVKMITGDHPVTARAVAREIGLTTGDPACTCQDVLTGAELEQLDEASLCRVVEQTNVFARVSPAHKLRIVSALQAREHVVAVTGDGVNDAPALKKADIGIAMGRTGTDVSKEAAAMTLLDDNFASIVAAIEEGRGIFENIKKYLMYLLSSNTGEILLMAGATLAGLPLPLSAVQILYVNLATDGLPALALSVDPPEPDLMRRPPRNPKAGLFTRPVVLLTLVGGIWSALINLGLFTWALHRGLALPHAMTLTFVSLVLIQFFKAYNYRSDRHSVFRRPFANRWLNLAILWELGLLYLILRVPVLEEAFGTVNLSLTEWGLLLALAATVVPVLELAKWFERRGFFGKLT
ncbi:cation-translocating P-type ATPase [Rhodocaloribacter litoris]|uniref:cation-translocating P-type ATPase n=1 Tax=Rhodocaloribacter litoris TaxID=2558931 RepID=UPI001420BDE1|nr:cation-translocating P-type ATPase [Rhodocaloribacter litoris]QXD15030.1 cation-translocating P-type ATPase [Rhodocaloribacter litoris]